MTKNVFNSLSHHTNKRRTTSLQECDYDHEIHLIDHTNGPLSRHQSLDETRSRTDFTLDQDSLTRDTDGSKRHSLDGTHGNRGKRHKVRKEVEKKRWSKKWTEDRPAERAGQVIVTAVDDEDASDITPTTSGKSNTLPILTTTPPKHDASDSEERGRPTSKRPSTMGSNHKTKHPECEEVIDILYENERGGFLCGIPLFSAKALGAFDHRPWTNIAFKPSATSIHNAQPPDPQWEWTDPEWRINHDPLAPKQDEDGWEYAFMFSKRCSWHGPTWYNSFVRRRAWTRRRHRVHKDGAIENEGHGLTADYFTIHSQRMRSLSPGTRRGQDSQTQSNDSQLRKEEQVDRSDIRDINHLMAALRESRIDREKMEVIESFVVNGGDDLLYLGKRMKNVMGFFIFQASRRVLLAHLSRTLDDAVEARKKKKEQRIESGELSDDEEKEEEDRANKRIANLMVAIKAADAEVKRLEYWSDIKEIAEEGATKGAVDEDKGWGEEWTGLDFSGPNPVITNANQPGGNIEVKERHEGHDDYGVDGANDDEEAKSPMETRNVDRGKGKGKEVRF